MKKFINFPLYPFLVSAYPALALLSANAGQVRAGAVLRPLLISLALGAALFFLLRGLFQRTHKAAFLTALWLTLFFAFGHLKMYLIAEELPADWLIYVWLGLFALTFFWVSRPRFHFESAALSLNVLSAALVVMSVWQFADGVKPGARALGAENAPVQMDLSAPAAPPDVYYIILDSYARADFLQQVYNFDNGEFIRALEARGFYVAACSRSNYSRTEISLASSLNMSYLQDLDSDFTPKNKNRSTLWNALKHSAARDNFERMGYQTVGFETGFAWNEVDDADFFITPPPISSGVTEFEGLFLDTTLARYLKEWNWIDPDELTGQTFRDRFHSVFNNLPRFAQMDGGQFVYAHVISPHPPFVFDAQGAPTRPADFWNEKKLYTYPLYQQGYLNQLQYLNQNVLNAVDEILAKSKTPPVIVIQGDHGAWMQSKDRHLWILNAYYLPDHQDALYKTISPVNTFRLIFDLYFGGRYGLLDDVSYYSPVPYLYDFSVVPSSCQ
ncbi:MAG: hypothetical protein Fur002_20620 [Anaerolineales bacterium]